MLRQRIDRNQGFENLGQIPVLGQLSLMKRGPTHEPGGVRVAPDDCGRQARCGHVDCAAATGLVLPVYSDVRGNGRPLSHELGREGRSEDEPIPVAC
jgi:hypothetical protein